MAKKEEKPNGWVFTDEDGEEIGFAEPREYHDAEDAYEGFSRGAADHFLVYYRKDGEIYSCASETTPDDI